MTITSKVCGCGASVFFHGDWRTGEKYDWIKNANFCSRCGRRLNEDGTTGKTYAELEAESAGFIEKLKKQYAEDIYKLCHPEEAEEQEDLNPWRLSNLPIEKPARP